MYGNKAAVLTFAIIATGVAGIAAVGLWFAKKTETAGREAGEEPVETSYARSETCMTASVHSGPSVSTTDGSEPTAYALSQSESSAHDSAQVDPSTHSSELDAPSEHAAKQYAPPTEADEPQVYPPERNEPLVPAAGQNLFDDAIAFCAELYRNTVTDLHSEPYYEFAKRLATPLTDAGVGNRDVVIASLLFGAVCNGTVSVMDIAERFGHQVGWLVDEVATAQSGLMDAELAVEYGEASALPEFYASLSWDARLILFAQRVDGMSEILEVRPHGWNQRDIDNYLLRAIRA